MTPGIADSGKQRPWLVIIDPQQIFAAPSSPWGSPGFAAAWQHIAELAQHYRGRTVITRWIPTADRNSSWGEYFKQWQFADVPETDPLYDLTPAAAQLQDSQIISSPQFGKWGPALTAITGDTPELIITGVATDCCVISTVLAAADAGAKVKVVTDAVAHSTPENGAAALHVMGLYAPQVTLTTTAEMLAEA